MIVDGGTLPWAEHPDRFPMFSVPEPAFHGVVYTEDHRDKPYIVRCRTVGLRNGGATLAPLSAFLLLQGLETMAIRLERQAGNTAAIANWLVSDARVAWVSWSGLPSHPDHQLAKSCSSGRFPSILTFGVSGGYEAGIKFFNSVKLFKRLVNLGDSKSLVSHPSSTTHRQLNSDEQKTAGVTPDMIRLSIGIEHVEDLIEDIDQALSAPRKGS